MGHPSRAAPALTVSVVIPVFNEAAHIGRTVGEAHAALAEAGVDGEIIVVDDGSDDGSGDVAEGAGARVLRQQNRGRLEARRAGLAEATGDHVLFLDSRVSLDPGALAYVMGHLSLGDVWNGHAVTDVDGNPYGRFWDVVSRLAFARYLDDPRTTSFGLEDFDLFPKGTTCFFAPRAVLVEAFDAFRSRYADVRRANDDTPLIRSIAAHRRIWISPEFACLYRPRTSLKAFLRHAFHRGIVFVDGHGRRDSRYRPVVLAFYPLSIGALAVALWKPLAVPVGVVALGGAAAAAARSKRRPAADVASFAALAPVYAVAHGLGMWRALTLGRS